MWQRLDTCSGRQDFFQTSNEKAKSSCWICAKNEQRFGQLVELRPACQPLIMGVSLMCVSWESARIRVSFMALLSKARDQSYAYNCGRNSGLYLISTRSQRVLGLFRKQVNERECDIQSRSERMTAWLRWGWKIFSRSCVPNIADNNWIWMLIYVYTA